MLYILWLLMVFKMQSMEIPNFFFFNCAPFPLQMIILSFFAFVQFISILKPGAEQKMIYFSFEQFSEDWVFKYPEK